MKTVMGKRELNRLKRKSAIVAVATRAFLEQGYAATSMSAIADEIGGSKATLWGHFGSKEELFMAVIDEQVALFAADMEGALVTEPFTIGGLRRFCMGYVRTFMRPQFVSLFRMIMGEGARFPEITYIFSTRGPSKLRGDLVRFLETGFSTDEAHRLARITTAAMVGFRSQILIRHEPLEPQEMEQFVDDFIAHLRLPEYESTSEAAQR